MTRLGWNGAMKLVMVWLVVTLIGGTVLNLAALQGPTGYPAPRFPVLPKDPTSVEEVMPYARQLVRNTVGAFGQGLGTARPGETIVIALPPGDRNQHIIEGIRRALIERKVKPVILELTEKAAVEWDYARALKAPLPAVQTAGHGALRQRPRPAGAPNSAVVRGVREGYREVRSWFDVFPRPHVPQKWLKSTRPDLYDMLYDKEDPDYIPQENPGTYRNADNYGGALLQDYLRKHPADGIYWGSTWIFLQDTLGPFRSKMRGSAVFDRWRVMSDAASYPGDVWALSETKLVEPIAFVDRAHFTDPEGTDISMDVSPDLARRWSMGVMERAHHMLSPNMATGRYARNVTSYPAREGDWIPRGPIALWNGVVASTSNHYGFFPKMEIHFKDGFVSHVVGGGTYGELMRTFLDYPGLKTLTYPFQDRPGFYSLAEMALGSNPKWFRPPTPPGKPMLGLAGNGETRRAGTIHIGIGTQLENEPTKTARTEQWQAFAEKHNVPMYHGFHMHAYFGTYRVHLRNANKWLALLERGRMTTLDEPEVRALASRYGNPDEVLADAWFPAYPGINAPGKFEDYARDPQKYHQAQNDQIYTGTWQYMRR